MAQRVVFGDYSAPFAPSTPGLNFKSATSACPYEDSRVTFILFRIASTYGTSRGTGRYCKTVADKREALLNFRPGNDVLLIAWPGKYEQDIFEITTVQERDKALARFGIVPRPAQPAKTFTAADGTVYVENSK